MNRKQYLNQRQRLLVAVSLIALMAAAASVWLSLPPKPAIPSVADLLAVPSTSSQLQLLGARRGQDGKPVSEFSTEEDWYNVPGLRALVAKRQTRADGSVVIDYYRPGNGSDSKRLLTLSYGPRQTGKRPHLLQKTSYTEDGTTVASDATYDPNTELRMTTSLRDDKGNYVNRSYYEDGVTVHTEDFVAASGGTDRTLWHKRFYPLGSLHVLSVKNADGVSRTVSEFDFDGALFKRTVTGTTSRQYDGQTVTIYYPGNGGVKMVSKTATSGTHVSYFQPPGDKLKSTWEMTRDKLTVTDYDDSGKNVVRVLVYDEAAVLTKTDDTIDHDEIRWTPREVHEKGPDGKDARVLYYKNGKLVSVDRFNVTVGGVTYARAHYDYRQVDGLWLSTSYYSQENGVASKVVTVGDDDGASHGAESTSSDITTTDLPLPPPQYQYGPYGFFGYFHDH